MFFMSGNSRLALAGIGACVLGLVMSVGAFAGFYPHQMGSNFPNGGAIILFLALFFTGELIGLFGLDSHLPGALPAAAPKKL